MSDQKNYQFGDAGEKIPLVLVGLSLVMLLLSACAPPAGADQPQATQPPAVSHGNDIDGYVDLVDALRAQGATVEPSGEIDQPFFDVPGQVITVNGAEVQVFEFAYGLLGRPAQFLG